MYSFYIVWGSVDWGVRGRGRSGCVLQGSIGLKVDALLIPASSHFVFPPVSRKDVSPRSKSDGILMGKHDVTERRKPVMILHPKKEGTGEREHVGLKKFPDLLCEDHLSAIQSFPPLLPIHHCDQSLLLKFSIHGFQRSVS